MSELEKTEERYRSLMKNRDMIRGGVAGLALGAAAGKVKKKVPHGVIAGLAGGGFLGRLKGEERALKDKLTQDRQDARWDARHKKHAAFQDELLKLSFLTALGTQLGKAALSTGTQLAERAGMKSGFNTARQALARSPLGGKNMARNVGFGVMGAGAAGLAGAGYAMGS